MGTGIVKAPHYKPFYFLTLWVNYLVAKLNIWNSWSCFGSIFNHMGRHLYFFNWGIAALQCCASFCCTMEQISYMYTYIPTLLEFPPSSAPCRIPPIYVTQVELNSPCSPAGFHSLSVSHLAVHIHQSQSPSSSYPHSTATHPFSTSESLFLPCK